jgi:G2/mitotic-specific cyclin 1/2
MEISLVDHRLLDHSPSLIAAASAWLARKCLERGEWNATLVHYSSYSQAELLGTAELMLDYCLRPCVHTAFFKKYSSKKFMRASTYVSNWARTKYPTEADEAQPLCSANPDGDDDVCIIDLYADEGVERPAGGSQWGAQSRGNTASVASRANTPLLDCSRDFDQEAELDDDE